jgi:pimeloyl-ACP methyl ester carboxylesterase
MQPLYFGAQRELFGVYEPRRTETGRNVSVVLCYPYGQDYMYAFRPYRSLAARLTRAGCHVLRFDYFGTGDSSGEAEQASISRWTADVIAAIDHVRSVQQTTVSLVGFRLGATLAATAAAECGGVDRLVLWDPVIHGSEYVSSLQARHRDWLAELVWWIPRSRRLAAEDDLLGFRFTEGFRKELERLSLRSLRVSPARDVLIVSTEENKADVDLGRQLSELGSNVDVKQVEDRKIPSMIPGLPLGLMPNRILKEIEGRLLGPVHG